MIRIVIISFFLLSSLLSFSQTPTDSVKTIQTKKLSIVLLYNGEQMVGEIISDDGRELLLSTEKIGKIYLSKSQIKEIKEFKSEDNIVIDGDYILESPFTTRYAFTSNAFAIKKNVNYSMINLYGPEIHFALTNKFSLGIMTTWIGSPLALAAKYTLPSKFKKTNFALGCIIGSSGYLLQGAGFGNLNWFTTTYGNRMSNISFSVGFGFINNFSKALSYRGGPLLSIAGIKKIGKRTSFIFDSMFSYTRKNEDVITPEEIKLIDGFGNTYYNYIDHTENKKITNIAFFIMPGMRFQKVENKAFQISLAGVINVHGKELNSTPIPMCSWFYKL